MHDWIAELQKGDRVLDLGSGAGSLKSFGYSCSVVSVDCDLDAFSNAFRPDANFHHVLGDGGALPFAPGVFDLVLCHHVLEHVRNLSATLAEIARVLKPSGRLFVSVPNGYGWCDSIYRYVFEGGDHVNRFERLQLVSTIESAVGLRLTHWQKLYSSFAYFSRLTELDRKIIPNLAPRLRRIARLPARLLKGFQGALYISTRLADRVAGVDWALYGWALYFEPQAPGAVEEDPPYVNVCLNCGSGHPAKELARIHKILYRCPTCDRPGIYFPPFRTGR